MNNNFKVGDKVRFIDKDYAANNYLLQKYNVNLLLNTIFIVKIPECDSYDNCLHVESIDGTITFAAFPIRFKKYIPEKIKLKDLI